jgi:hypothetical protein
MPKNAENALFSLCVEIANSDIEPAWKNKIRDMLFDAYNEGYGHAEEDKSADSCGCV